MLVHLLLTGRQKKFFYFNVLNILLHDKVENTALMGSSCTVIELGYILGKLDGRISTTTKVIMRKFPPILNRVKL